MARTILDYVNHMIDVESRKGKELTYKEWCEIRRSGDEDAIAEAVERMMAQGGYDNLV